MNNPVGPEQNTAAGWEFLAIIVAVASLGIFGIVLNAPFPDYAKMLLPLVPVSLIVGMLVWLYFK